MVTDRVNLISLHRAIELTFLKAFFFKGYSQYFNNYKSCLQTISRLRDTNSKFASFLKEHEIIDGHIIPLEQYMITPVQRITRYELLLQNMVANTWKTHKDYDALVQALNHIAKANDQVNEMKRLRENYDKLIEIYNQLRVGKKCNWDKIMLMKYSSKRRFLREGNVFQHTAKNQSVKFFCILFEDLILWTKPKKSMLVLKYCTLLENVKIDLRSEYSQQWDYIYTIHIKTPSEHLIIRGETDTETLDWNKDLRRCSSQVASTSRDANPQTVQSVAHGSEKKGHDVAEEAAASEMPQDATSEDPRRPRVMRARLGLTGLRLLEDYRNSFNFQTQLELKRIRDWQSMPDSGELDEYQISNEEINRIIDMYPESIYETYFDLQKLLLEFDIGFEVPHLLIIGLAGGGKTSLLDVLLDISLPQENLKRPLYIHTFNNKKYTDEPLLTILKDLKLDPPVLKNVTVSKSELKNELLRRATEDYSENPIHLRYEHARILNAVLVDTPGLDVHQFYDEEGTSENNSHSTSKPTVRRICYNLAKQPKFQLLFVEECKSKNLMSAIEDLTSVVDPTLNRSFFVYSKFYHKLRDFYCTADLNSYLSSLVSAAPAFFVTLPSFCSSSATDTGSQQKRIAQAYLRDLEALHLLQYDTRYDKNIGVYNLKFFFMVWQNKFSIRQFSGSLNEIAELEASTLDKYKQVQESRKLLNLPELRSLSNSLAYHFAQLLQNAWKNTSIINSQIYGQTLEDEEYQQDYRCRHWITGQNNLIFLSDKALSKIRYKNCRLYGLPQLRRLLAVFHAVVRQLDVGHVDMERIHLFIKQNRCFYANDYFDVLYDIAHERVKHALSTLLRPFCKRIVGIFRRLGFIAYHLVSDKNLAPHKEYRNFQTLINHVYATYNYQIAQFELQCLSNLQNLFTERIKLNYLDYLDDLLLSDANTEDTTKANLNLISRLFVDISERFCDNINSACCLTLAPNTLKSLSRDILNHVSELTNAQIEQIFCLNLLLEPLDTKQRALEKSLRRIRQLRSEFSAQYKMFQSCSETYSKSSLSIKYQVCHQSTDSELQKGAD
ncbi:dynamin-like protein A [Schistocerca gregaria]|uniref:dynamin-like protein A n=1 Tax=Schistocerca gregaria TaxID=7010 RepID=UPI00211F404B|nr:dynamin-like protein A [Schistocerca gregaria]